MRSPSCMSGACGTDCRNSSVSPLSRPDELGGCARLVRRSRSMLRFGRYSEATRFIRSLHDPVMRFAAALAGEFDAPPRARNSWDRQFQRGRAANPPARCCRRRCGQGIILASPPAPDHQRHGCTFLSRELKPASRGHGRADDFADHRCQAAVPEPFFHHRQRVFVLAAIGIDQPVRRKTCLGERRREQVAAGHHPQDCAVGRHAARRQPGRKQGCCRVIGKAAARSRHFVERVGPEPAACQPAIDIGNPESKAAIFAWRSRCLDCADGLAHCLKL